MGIFVFEELLKDVDLFVNINFVCFDYDVFEEVGRFLEEVIYLGVFVDLFVVYV